ncbi:MAG: amidohydrolase family protein [Nitrospiraceae bacterium]|nr:amidohydrolase family protein [Nitrospiraceae bacterium]
MNNIIDFHTHAFPDELAARAMRVLEKEGGIDAHHDGRLSSLLASMDRCGIEKSIVCSIATKPSQYQPILNWSKEIMSDRILPFPSLHPDDPDYADRVRMIKEEGFKGIKFHPYYQDFVIDDQRVFPIYEKIAGAGLIVLMHTGFDFAFDRERIADPKKILNVVERFPELKIVTSHLGAWDDWDEVERLLAGRSIYMEISYALDLLSKEKARGIILKHPREYLLFGTDSPWTGQEATLSLFLDLQLGPEIERAVLYDNAARLLNSV